VSHKPLGRRTGVLGVGLSGWAPR